MSLMRQPALNLSRDAVRLVSGGRAGGITPATFSSLRPVPKPWTCPNCRETRRSRIQENTVWRRQISNTTRRRDERPNDTPKPIDPIPNARTGVSESSTPASSSSSLPSHTDHRRSDVSKRASRILDELLARASLASQHINAYTGTDYSGIEALRQEIIEQEQRARKYHTAVDEAKARHHEAYAKQTSAQREIVGLLERKSSWTPADLERYMSLVRSEHLNDRDVQIAKDNLAVAERELEAARSLMERLERKQYHEEQIWSDTIRRNSTWVTFGLMGVNIVLLLAQIVVFEPYRRKKIVQDVKSALDEKTVTAIPSPANVEKQFDASLPLEGVSSAQTQKEINQPLDRILPPAGKKVADASLILEEVLSTAASTELDAVAVVHTKAENPPVQPPAIPSAPRSTWEAYQEAFRDLFSERIVQLRRVDVTNTALQGAATGVAAMGILFVLLRPK